MGGLLQGGPAAVVNLGTSGLIAGRTGPDANGYFTTVAGIHPTTPLAFPAGSVLQSVAIESYLTVNGVNLGGDAVVGFVGTPRRSVADINLCLTCHEGLGFHSNSGRRNNITHCAMCHNPETSSSNTFAGWLERAGTGPAPPAAGTILFSSTEVAGWLPFAEKPMNMKDLVHGLHASSKRVIPFNFIRGTPAGGSGNGAYDFDHIGYPTRLSECGACHASTSSYDLPLDQNALWSVVAVQARCRHQDRIAADLGGLPELPRRLAGHGPHAAERRRRRRNLRAVPRPGPVGRRGGSAPALIR